MRCYTQKQAKHLHAILSWATGPASLKKQKHECKISNGKEINKNIPGKKLALI